MIKATITVSAILKDDRIANASQIEFCNKVCRECALWGAPNDPCRERLTYHRTGMSQVEVTCQNYTKNIDLTIKETQDEALKLEALLKTRKANLEQFMATPIERVLSTREKMNRATAFLDGETPKADDQRAKQQKELEWKVDQADKALRDLNRTLSDLRAKQLALFAGR